MTFPLIEMSEYRAYVEVARGRKLDQWRDMFIDYRGPGAAGQTWTGDEGERLAIRYVLFPDDPNSELSWPPHVVDSERGLGVGKPRRLVVP